MVCVLVHIQFLNFIDEVQKPQNFTGISQNVLHHASILTSLLFSCLDSLHLNTSASGAYSPARTDLTLVLITGVKNLLNRLGFFFAVKQKKEPQKNVESNALLFVKKGVKCFGY